MVDRFPDSIPHFQWFSCKILLHLYLLMRPIWLYQCWARENANQRACLVGRENVKELESLESLGFCVIYIYPGAHKFSLSISHFFWAHTLYFSSLLNLSLLSIFTPFTFQFFTFLPTTKHTLNPWKAGTRNTLKESTAWDKFS